MASSTKAEEEEEDVDMVSTTRQDPNDEVAVTTAAAAAAAATTTDDGDEDLLLLPTNRFELELEFVQCLASPAYLHYLATTGTLTDPSFVQFLDYLQYWKTPTYVRLITYPHCLFFLDQLITNPLFRRELANVSFRNFIHEQQFYSWQFRAQHLYGRGLLPPQSSSAAAAGAVEETRQKETSGDK